MNRDFLWPPDDRLSREADQSRLIARRDAQRRNRENRRLLLQDLAVALFVVACGVLLLWALAAVVVRP